MRLRHNAVGYIIVVDRGNGEVYQAPAAGAVKTKAKVKTIDIPSSLKGVVAVTTLKDCTHIETIIVLRPKTLFPY